MRMALELVLHLSYRMIVSAIDIADNVGRNHVVDVITVPFQESILCAVILIKVRISVHRKVNLQLFDRSFWFEIFFDIPKGIFHCFSM